MGKIVRAAKVTPRDSDSLDELRTIGDNHIQQRARGTVRGPALVGDVQPVGGTQSQQRVESITWFLPQNAAVEVAAEDHGSPGKVGRHVLQLTFQVGVQLTCAVVRYSVRRRDKERAVPTRAHQHPHDLQVGVCDARHRCGQQFAGQAVTHQHYPIQTSARSITVESIQFWPVLNRLRMANNDI